jgi:hypothetical protein
MNYSMDDYEKGREGGEILVGMMIRNTVGSNKGAWTYLGRECMPYDLCLCSIW